MLTKKGLVSTCFVHIILRGHVFFQRLNLYANFIDKKYCVQINNSANKNIIN